MPREWKQYNKQVLDSIDIRAEYEKMGLKIKKGANPSSKGWLACHPIGRDDEKSGSAAINVGDDDNRGRYTDRSSGTKKSFFDFAAEYGGFGTWKAARDYYAKNSSAPIDSGKVAKPFDKPKPKKVKPNDPGEDQFIRLKSTAAIRIWCQLKSPVIKPEAVIQCGGFAAVWPATAPSRSQQSIIAFPIWSASDLTKVVGHVLMSASKGPLSLYRGEDAPRENVRFLVTKGAGLGFVMSEESRKLILEGKASLIWKVEGMSDMLSATSANTNSKHAIITNAMGANETPDRSSAAIFNGFDVAVCHDADIPGQDGAKAWVSTILTAAKSVRNVQLPYKVRKNHGKDIRFFLESGKSYADLEAIADATTPLLPAGPAASGGDSMPQLEEIETPEQYLLRKLGIEVLGEYSDGSIEAFSTKRKKMFLIKSIRFFGFADLLQAVGEDAMAHVVDAKTTQEPGKTSVAQVRNAIAIEAGRCRLSSKTSLGAGCWKMQGSEEIIIVGDGSGAIYDGSKLQILERPKLSGHVFDFAATDSWYDFHRVQKLVESKNVARNGRIFDSLESLFSKWRWKAPGVERIVAALVACTWVQSIWPIRPLVAVTGASNAGKSTLFEVLTDLFGQMAMYAQKPTEAGIRQHIRNNSFAVLLDELEHDTHRGRVMELLRSSSRGGSVIRGTTSQKGMSFTMRHLVWIASTESGLKKEPDKNRFVALELASRGKPNGQPVPAFTKPPKEELEELGRDIFAVAVSCVNEAIKIAEELKTVEMAGVNARIVEIYSIPCAMYSAIYGLSRERAEKELRSMLMSRVEGDVTPDEEDLLSTIMGSQFYVGGGNTVSVSEVIVRNESRAQYADHMERNGIAMLSGKSGPRKLGVIPEFLFVHPSLVQRHLLKNTRWGADGIDISQILKRIDGAKVCQHSLSGSRYYGVEIPTSKFVGFDVSN